MNDEEDLDLTTELEPDKRNDKRYKDLADKVKTTAEERDQIAEEKAKAEAEAQAAKKEAEFYKGFNTVASKYEGANEYQDKILEKVNAGYDIEDATVAVLNKEGKFNPERSEPSVSPQSPAGGSATTTMTSGDEKPINEMSRDEKREALEQIERESGGVSQILRRGL